MLPLDSVHFVRGRCSCLKLKITVIFRFFVSHVYRRSFLPSTNLLTVTPLMSTPSLSVFIFSSVLGKVFPSNLSSKHPLDKHLTTLRTTLPLPLSVCTASELVRECSAGVRDSTRRPPIHPSNQPSPSPRRAQGDQRAAS